MRSGLIIFVILFFQLGKGAFAQRVTIERKNILLTDVFKEIHKQTGYGFIYSDKLLSGISKVDIKIIDESIEKAMDICLLDQPLNFQIEGRIITITEKFTDKKPNSSISKSFRARITDDSGKPIPGSTIRLVGKDAATYSDNAGFFRLSAVTPADTIEISCLSFETKREMISNIGSDIALKSALSKLDEVQVIAYGQTTNRLSTGSVTTVSARDLEKVSSPNVLEALAGLVPGLVITQTGSNPASNSRIVLRGMNTLSPDFTSQSYAINTPLVLLDGFQLSTGTTMLNDRGLLQSGVSQAAMTQSPLFNINPDDIESISILKDADATAIYGSNGANGVILITSKKPAAGKLQVHGNIKQGYSSQVKNINLLNTQDYLAMRKEAMAVDRVTPTNDNAYDLLLWDNNRNTNWQKELSGIRSNTTAQLGVAGGSSLISYRLNSSYYYNNENPGLKNSITEKYKDQRGTVDLSIFTQSSNGRLKSNVRAAIASVRSSLPSSDASNAVYLAPNAPELLNASGTLNWDEWRVAKGFPADALALFKPYSSRVNDKDFNIGTSYRAFRELEFNVSGSYRSTSADEKQIVQSAATTDPMINNPALSTTFGKNNFKMWSGESNIKYILHLNSATLQFLTGIQYSRNLQNFDNISASGWPAGASQENIGDAVNLITSSRVSEIRTASIYSRITYNYADRFIVNLTGRRDGSSNFGNGKKYGNFGSAGAAWVFSREPWLKELTENSIFSFGKLRASYGTTGQAVPIPYTYLTITQANQPLYQGLPTNVYVQSDNPDVKWAQTRKLDAALDIGLIDDRLLLSVNWYRNKTSDIVTYNPVTLVTGFTNLYFNQPSVILNTGTELAISYRQPAVHKFNWSISANIGINRNKLLSFHNLERSYYFSYGIVINESINRYFIPAEGTVNVNTGNYIRAVQGSNYKSVDPQFTGGLQPQVSFRGFNLSFNFTFARQRGLNTVVPVVIPGTITSGISNQPYSVLQGRWQKPGDVTHVPKLSANGFADIASYATEFYYGDASYICLKNARFTYNVFKETARHIGVAGVSASLTGHNLFYITKFKGINPELPVDGTISTRRLLDLGITVNF